MNNQKTYRIIDANINRVTEGLRVIEDIFRYYYDDASIQQALKEIRHHIASNIEQTRYIASRESLSDIGFSSKGSLEYKREDISDIIRSNMKRVQEGLRVLEEMFKLDSALISMDLKKIRYELYEIDKKIVYRTRKTLKKGLYLIMTDPPMGYEELTKMAVSAHIPAIQLRYKGKDSTEFLNLALKIREITKGSETLFFVNDRPDIALLAKADGVHVGQGDLSPSQVRKLFGNEVLIGLSTHKIEQVLAAQQEPVDYIGFGPVFPTISKDDHDPITGVDGLTEAIRLSKLPIVAIGGINRDNIRKITGFSCNSVAVISAVANAKNPVEEMSLLQEICLEEL